jgi:1-acyl-sn-glycerol-3-phosphate acyltransferase
MTVHPLEPEAPVPDQSFEGDESSPIHSHFSRWLTVLLRPIHTIFTAMYFRVEVANGERIPVEGPAVLAVTHRSRWDAVVLYCATKRLMRFPASRDEFVGAQGWFMRRVGSFPIDTRRPSPAALRLCRDLILAGEALVLFPEGTIYYYPRGHVHPIKPGAAWLALLCQEHHPSTPVPLVPIRLVYGDRYPRFRTHLQIVVGEPIELGPYLKLPRRVAIRRLTADLQRALGDIVNESLAEMISPRGATISHARQEPR